MSRIGSVFADFGVMSPNPFHDVNLSKCPEYRRVRKRMQLVSNQVVKQKLQETLKARNAALNKGSLKKKTKIESQNCPASSLFIKWKALKPIYKQSSASNEFSLRIELIKKRLSKKYTKGQDRSEEFVQI